MCRLPYNVSVFIPTVVSTVSTEATLSRILGDTVEGREAIYMTSTFLEDVGIDVLVSVLSKRGNPILFLEDSAQILTEDERTKVRKVCHLVNIQINLFVKGNAIDKFEVLWQGYNFSKLTVFISDGIALENVFFNNSITDVVVMTSYFVGANKDLVSAITMPRLDTLYHEDGSRLELTFAESMYCPDNNCALTKYNVTRRYTQK